MNKLARTLPLVLCVVACLVACLVACAEDTTPAAQLSAPAAGTALETVPRTTLTVDPEAAKVLPADSVAVAHVRSPAMVVYRLGKIVDAFQPGMSALVNIAPLISPTGLRESALELTGDAVVAVRMGEAGPEPTIVLPAKKPADAAVTAAMEAIAVGKYVALSTKAEPVVGAASAMGKNLLAGDISMRIDVAKAIAPMRSVIDSYLDAKNLARINPALGVEQQSVLQPLLDVVKELVAGVRTLDLALTFTDDALDLDAVVTVSEELADRTSGDFDLLKRLPLTDASVLAYARFDWAAMSDSYAAALSRMTLQGLPDQKVMEPMMKKATELYGLMGPEVAAAYRVAPDGFEVMGLSRGGQPDAFLTAFQEYMTESQKLLATLGSGQEFERLADLTFAGVPFLSYRLPATPGVAGRPVNPMFGDGVRLSVGAQGAHTFFATQDAERRMQSLVDAAEKGSLYEMPLLDSVKGLHARPKAFVAIDLRRVLGVAATLTGKAVPDGPPVIVWASLAGTGRRYELQAHVDLLALGKLITAMR